MANNFKECKQKGIYGEKMVKKYIPSTRYMKYLKDDKEGADIFYNNQKYQVKFDNTIHRTGNLYFEMFEKTINKEHQTWRKSPIAPELKGYMFIHSINLKNIYNEEVIIYIVLMKDFKEYIKENESRIRQISVTSKGYLIPVNSIKREREQYPKKPTQKGLFF